MTKLRKIFGNLLFPSEKKHSCIRVLLLCTVFISLSSGLFAQTVIKGNVVDKDGAPLVGVSVSLKSTSYGIITDNDGYFTLITNSPLPLTLSLSSLGYKNLDVEVSDAGRPLVITLQENINVLDEALVTAGGSIRPKRAQDYASTKITNTKLVAAKPVSIAGGLTAKVPGLQVNAISSGVNPTYRLVLRGNRSITGENQALIVIDNIVASSAILNNINAEDVEDIQVLNGASGATLYGSEASNGVIIVTTKKGKKGKPVIKVAQTLTFQEVSFFPKLQSRFGQGSSAGAQVFDPVENQQYGPAFDGSLRELGYPLENGDQQYTTYSAKSDRQDFWETGVQTQSDVSISFGNDNYTSYVSAQYLNSTGTTPFDKYSRVSLRLNNSQKILKNLTLSYNASYVENNYDITSQTGYVYEDLQNIPANIPVTSYKDYKNNIWATPEGYFNPWYTNPYWTAALYRNESKNTYLTGNVELKLEILPWISVLYRASISHRYYQSKQYSDKYTYSDYARTVQGKTDIAGSIYDGQINTYRYNHDFQLAIDRKIGDFKLNLTLGLSNVYKDYKITEVSASGLVIPGLYNISNRSVDPSPNSDISHSRTYGVWGDFVGSYKNYLFLHVTGRNDWTSLLAPQNRSYFYPSVGVSFVPTDAFDFLKDSDVLGYLKLRAAWSKTGNVNIGAHSLLAIYNSVAGYSNGTYFRESADLVSPDLKPEITKGYEVGTEFSLLKNLAEVQFNYYFTSTTGQAISASVASSSGYTGYLLNTGEVTNRGIEASLRLNPIKEKDWNLEIGANYTHNKNFLKELHPDTKRIGVNGSGVIYAEEGYELNQIIVADYARVPAKNEAGVPYPKELVGKVIVDKNTGYPSLSTESAHLGNTTPKYRLGLDLNLRWKQFSLGLVFEYRGGYYFASIAQGSNADFTGASARSAYYNRERFVFPNSAYLNDAGEYVANTNVTVSDGGSGFWTNATYNRGAYSNYVYSGAYWKWRELSLSYVVPKSVFAKLSNVVKEVTVSVQGRNLFLWTPLSNEYTDPDYSANDNNAIGVATLSQSPPTRYFGGTISITF
ncbi:MAG: SusC/RagA family TonB-linked outer membrane protein [Prevotellaceae bacterium]|jgi:TonB-linked SusC/RagA family outer membrane protein|nr:SusC/RagA family TonB-linked outer membrane protein [Prevotellaceae bacterium]